MDDHPLDYQSGATQREAHAAFMNGNYKTAFLLLLIAIVRELSEIRRRLPRGTT
jgi:hypothetical protein